MNSSLAPKYIRKIKDVSIIWFENSNRYLVLNNDNMHLLSVYLNSTNKVDFINNLDNDTKDQSNVLFDELELLLKECNESYVIEPKQAIKFTNSKHWLIKNYIINDLNIQINYSSENVKKLIHPQFAYLETSSVETVAIEFHVSLENNQLHLFNNKKHCGTFPKTDSHFLQGKFAIELLCALTKTVENDWLGTFHASTISNNNEAVMLVGNSGKGKSTLASILMSKGFKLIADDFTPVLAKTQTVYNYPAAISIKEGSFKALEPLIKNLNDSKIIATHTSKGKIRYIPGDFLDFRQGLKCNKIVLVNYKKGAEISLKEILPENILNILIPDSWLSPIPENVEYFLNWLERITFYELTYSNNEEVALKFHELLKV